MAADLLETVLRNLFAAGAEAFTVYQLFNHFLTRKNKAKRTLILSSSCLIVLLTAISHGELFLVNAISAIILLLLYGLLNFDCDWKQAGTWTLLFMMLGMISEGGTTFAASFLFDVNMQAALTDPLIKTICYIASKSIALLLVLLIIRLFPSPKQKFDKKSFVLLAFPICAIVNEFIVLYWSSSQQLNRTSLGWSVVLSALMIVAGFAVILTYTQTMHKREEEQARKLEHQKEEANQKYYMAQERNTHELRAVLHDFKNQLLGLEALYQSASPEAAAYTEALLTRAQHYEQLPLIRCKNAVLSNAIQHVQIRCQQLEICFSAQIACADLSFIEPLDVSSIFDNAFDNAIEACERLPKECERWIQCHAREKGNFVLFSITNSCDTDFIKVDSTEEPHLLSTKTESENHGIGLSNINRMAQKYEGGVVHSYGNGQFQLLIRLQKS